MIEIDWHPDRRKLRRFGVTMLIGFAILAALAELVLDRRTLAIGLAAGGATTGVVGLTATAPARWLYTAWMGLAFVIGSITSRVLVAVVYYAVFTPIGLVLRLFGRDRLQRRPPNGTMWVDLPPGKAERESYERQF